MPVEDDLRVIGAYGRKGSEVKASDLYHHLVTKHHISLRSDNYQSEGGMKVWNRVSQHPDIEVTHHAKDTGRQLPLYHGNLFPKNYGNETYFRAAKKNNDYAE